MPYTIAQMKNDDRFKGMPRHAMEVFAAAFGSAEEQYKGDEAKQFATAWAAVKKAGYEKDGAGKWHKVVKMAADFADSLSDLQQRIYAAVRTAYKPLDSMNGPWPHIEDWQSDNTVIVEIGQRMVKVPYSVDAKTGVVTVDTAKAAEVREVKTYKLVTATMAEFRLDEGFVLDDTVEFSDDGVIRTGKVFEIGDYPDKAFSLTEEEADQAIADFQAVDNDLEHTPTILSGKLGQLKSVWRQGKDLFGKVAIPKWLHEAVGSDPIKTSLAWNRQTKRIAGNGLVLHPRVKDAQLIAAFTAANSTTGGSTDMPQTATNPDKKAGLLAWIKAKFAAGDRPEGVEDADLDRVEFASDPPASGQPVQDPKPDAGAQESQAQFAQAQATIKTQGDEIEGLRAASISSAAVAFFDAALKANKVVPAEREALIAQFTQAVKDDARDAHVACFTAEGGVYEGTRLKSLKAGIEARVPHSLTSEQIAAFALPNTGDDAKAKADRLNKTRAEHGLPAKKEG